MEHTLPIFIGKLEESLPSIVSDSDLIKAGLFNSAGNLSMLRQKGKTPPYIVLGKRIRYMKDDVISWVKNQCHNTQISR